jgi:hypothetical protein
MNIHDFARKPDVILQPPTSPHLLVLSIIAPPASRVADRSSRRVVGDLGAGVGVHLALAAGHDDVHEAAGVCETLLRAALGDLLLLLLLDLCAHAMSAIVVPKRGAHAMAVGAEGGEMVWWVIQAGGERSAALEGEWYRTLGVCDLTLPARASEPWTLPMLAFDLGF